jgi:hypothetical protein
VTCECTTQRIYANCKRKWSLSPWVLIRIVVTERPQFFCRRCMRISAAAVKIRQRRVSWVNNTRQREYFMICTLHAFTRVHPPAFYIFYSSARAALFAFYSSSAPPTHQRRKRISFLYFLRAVSTDRYYLFISAPKNLGDSIKI